MTILLGLDLGTTTLTALAVDGDNGLVLAKHTLANDARRASADGYSEWDVVRLRELALACLRAIAEQLAERPAAIGITGQQHGCLLRDAEGNPTSPLVNWQDQRGHRPFQHGSTTYVDEVRRRLCSTVAQRCGCRVAGGYMSTTLFWFREQGRSFADEQACFLPDDIAAHLTGGPPTTDPTLAASAGIYNLHDDQWDEDALAALGLSPNMLPHIVPSGQVLGSVQGSMLADLAGVPVVVPLGDNQASVFGSLPEPATSVVVNIGTGGQVSVVVPEVVHGEWLETRPYLDGYLLTSAGLAGGRAYAAFAQFIAEIGRDFFHQVNVDVYATLNNLASKVAAGSDGVICEPFFGGTRWEPERRGKWTGIGFEQLKAGHLARALLEGTAHALAEGYARMRSLIDEPRQHLIGAGNGLRENALLRTIVATQFSLPMQVPLHTEEAAFGAALVAGVGVGLFANWSEARRCIHTTPAPSSLSNT